MSKPIVRKGPLLASKDRAEGRRGGCRGDRPRRLPGSMRRQDVQPRRRDGYVSRSHGRAERRSERCLDRRPERRPVGCRDHPVQDRLRQPADRAARPASASPTRTSSAWPGQACQGASTVGGKNYAVDDHREGQPVGPGAAAQVANDLINSDNVDLMLATSTPETVNPVSDASEAAGVPCISTVVPWEAWYFGRGAKDPAQPSPFKCTYHFCFGVAAVRQRLHAAVAAGADEQEGRRDVAERRRRQRDPRRPRAAAREGRLHDRRPGRLPGRDERLLLADRASSSSENCEIFNTFPIPPDFATFWRQAAQQGYEPKIAQIAKTGLFASQVEALGHRSAYNLASGAYWGPTWPYTSSLTGTSSADLASRLHGETGKQWNQQLGPEPRAVRRRRRARSRRAATRRTRRRSQRDEDARRSTTPLGKLDWGKRAGPERRRRRRSSAASGSRRPERQVHARLRHLRELRRPQRPDRGEAEAVQP